MKNHVDLMNSFLRGEIAAVETYRQAIAKVGDASTRMQLEHCRRSHQERVNLLRDRILRLGGTPADGSGMWGTFAKLVEGGAKVFGDKAAIDCLEEGEDHGLKDYRTHLNELDTNDRFFVEQELLPGQVETHSAMSTLKHEVHIHG